jgi:hypothetical protein
MRVEKLAPPFPVTASGTPPGFSCMLCGGSTLTSAEETKYAVNIPRHTVIVPAYFVSSALVKVEPPQSMQLKPGGVPLAVTGNGGASFSTRILLYSHKFPLEQ